MDVNEVRRRFGADKCIACGHCTYICPASHGRSEFSPRRFMEALDLRGTALGLDTWSCMTCAACSQICPHGVEFHHLLRSLREGQEQIEPMVRTHAGIVTEIRELDARNKGTGHGRRWLWEGLQIDDRSDTVLFVGCLPLLDVVFQDTRPGLVEVTNAVIALLNAIGIRPRLLQAERCCGHDAHWLGERETFLELARTNLRTFKECEVKRVITYCPECHHTLARTYVEEFGAQDFEVVHLSQLLEEALRRGELRLTSGGERMTYQDPCRLGRGLGIYREPRELLRAIGDLVEMERNGPRSACCGSTQFANCDPSVKGWQLGRIEEACSTGAGLLVTSCPKCLVHLSCAMKEVGTYKDRKGIPLQDLYILLYRHLEK